MTLPPIPESTLRATYTRAQPYYRDWPVAYEQGMANAVIAAIVDMLARRQVPSFGRRRADRQGVKLRANPVYVITPDETPPGIPGALSYPRKLKGLAPGEIDRKRAAAGDTDKGD